MGGRRTSPPPLSDEHPGIRESLGIEAAPTLPMQATGIYWKPYTSWRAMIEALIAGESDPDTLAGLAHRWANLGYAVQITPVAA